MQKSDQVQREQRLEIVAPQVGPAATKVWSALANAQTRHSLFQPQESIVVAVSGGADSLCLLHALHHFAPQWQLSLHVAHLDHALRPDSADDAAFVEDFAQKLELPFYSERLTPGILDDDPRGLEDAARSARYRFLRHVATMLPHSTTLVTAHHQDDQAESLLIHLVQGSGLNGLAGMAWVATVPDNQAPPLRLVRPFLALDRASLQAYLRAFGLEWREDSSNQELSHLRNRMRHQVLPLLATINPNIHATLARTAELLAAEADHAASRDRALLAQVQVADATTEASSNTHQTRLVLDWFQLQEADVATQRGLLRQALLTLDIDVRNLGMEGIDALLEQVRLEAAGGPHPLLAGWQWTSIRYEGRVQLSLHRNGVLPFVPQHAHLRTPMPKPLPIPRQGTISTLDTADQWHLHSTLLSPHQLPSGWRSRQQPWHFFGDDKRCDDLLLTTFQAGMEIAPLGMKGHHRSVGDIFTDHKVPPYLRPGWPIIVQADGTEEDNIVNVVWLCGLAVADAIAVHAKTHQVRHLRWTQDPHPDQLSHDLLQSQNAPSESPGESTTTL